MIKTHKNFGPDRNRARENIDGKSVLVTGGTGSFGRAFISHLLHEYNPKRLIVLSRDELKQYEMAIELPVERFPALRYFIGDVRDIGRLELAFRDIDFVVHAAAMKQVPTAEYNPFECIHTNVLGAENIVRAAMRCGVKKVIALSTDKAANPINLYGASKLAADKIFVASNNMAGDNGTRFSVVRYGNVIGSRGSVLPFFQKLIREGATSLPITDPRMTRFWITLSQGVDFVLSCMTEMRGGEIFVPKIPSMKISSLARVLAPDLPHENVGVRPGEKLHEVMITEDDARYTIEYPDHYVIQPAFPWWTEGYGTAEGAQPAPENFRYASDSNTEWLDKDELMAIVNEIWPSLQQ